jgi:hypothetical protein
MRLVRVMRGLWVTGVLVTLWGCTPPLIPFSLDTPPVVLTPISFANITDGRARFREIYCAVRADHGIGLPEDLPCDDALVRLPGEPQSTGHPANLASTTRSLRVVVVPGIFDECIRKYVQTFSDGLAHLERHGWRTGSIPVSGRSGTAHNASQVRDFVLGLSLGTNERVLLVAYSKGAADTLEALDRYPEILPRVAAMVSVAGVIGGSPLADGYVHLYEQLMRDLALADCPAGDGQGMASITRAARQSSLARRPPPSSVKYFSVAGIPGPQRISRALRPFYEQLAYVDPRSDGQVIFFDAIIPAGTLLGFLRADHWALAVPFSRNAGALPFSATLIDHNAFPREVLLEAIVRFVEEGF